LKLILVILAALVLIAAAYRDARSLTIPNYLVGILTALALVNALIMGSWSALGWLGALGVLAVGFLMWKAGLMGAGDVKLAAASLLWLPGQVSEFLFLVAVLGGLLALGYLLAGWLKKKKFEKIPFGVPLALSTIAILTWNSLHG
jgi:prepilin peptidase CpaA